MSHADRLWADIAIASTIIFAAGAALAIHNSPTFGLAACTGAVAYAAILIGFIDQN